MFKKRYLLLIIIILVSCTASKSVIITKKSTANTPNKTVVTTPKKTNSTTKPYIKNTTTETIESTSKTIVNSNIINDYVFRYKAIAMKNMKNYGIPASIILAQGILESGAGQGDLATSANNHFGIKCYKDWTGETVFHDDDASQECFRKYNNPEDSFQDHADILSKRTRYSSLFSLPNGDYVAWANGLKTAGYATDIKYPDKLISYIERYNLHQYDAQVLGTKYTPIVKQIDKSIILENQNNTLYEVQKSDTFYSISKKFNLTVEELKQKNNLTENTLSIGQKLIVK
jgi:flagellum-specific peptidoglycan hydrolase FlgJ